MKKPGVIFLILSLISLSIYAQNYRLPATYGEIDLAAGFQSYSIEMTAKGAIGATSLGEGCFLNISDAPDLQVTFEAGGNALVFSVESEFFTSDTSLIINLPDGNWACDDDSGSGLNPFLTLENPSSGIYDIWVGSVYGMGYTDAILTITE